MMDKNGKVIMSEHDAMAVMILEQIVRLNNFNDKIKNLFGVSDNDTEIEIATDRLLTVFFALSSMDRMNGFPEDDIYAMIWNCKNWVEAGNLYVKFHMLAPKGE